MGRPALLAANVRRKAGVGTVCVEEDDPVAGVVADAVRHSRQRGVERAWCGAEDGVAGHEPGLALDHEERVDGEGGGAGPSLASRARVRAARARAFRDPPSRGRAGSHLQDQLACEHEEHVDVVEMDVRVGAALARRVARPGRVQPLVLAQDPQLPRRRVRYRLALSVTGN